ncbi:MAG TPA: DUF1800 domain-containing protein [Candidatus Binatia bacterium]|jgi:uncharacterized protein (DUF1800 family)|nr:DUF1800 domain-containing protein [Candidatus Binatia bacterium]
MVVWNEENVAHLLSRAGFGGNDKDVSKYLRYGQSVAVDRLVDVKGSPSKGPGKADFDKDDLSSLRAWWIKRMVKASTRRVQEKMCLYWHDHFATGVDVVKNNLWMSKQNATFRLYGLGSFRTLCIEITRDAAMLDFLDGRISTATKPNENYGREFMELFALGVSDLNGVDNYTQSDVEEVTRAFTGFEVVSDVGTFNPARFDGGNKTFFATKPHQAGPANFGVVDTAQVPLATNNAIDAIFAHRDSDGELTMPRFLAKKFWEYFAYPAPTKALLDELTPDFIAGGFIIADLLRAVFMHDEFYSTAAKTQSVKNPCEFAVHAIRALGASTNAKGLPDYFEEMGMSLFEPPGVNGWAQGKSWLSSGQFLARVEFAQALAAGRSSELKLTPKKVIDSRLTSAAAVTDQLLGRLGIASHVPADARQALIDYFGGATNFNDSTVLEKKVRGAIVLMLALPEFQIH